MTQAVLRQYRELRKRNYPAKLALYVARVNERFAELEADGIVMLEIIPDEYYETEGSYATGSADDDAEMERLEAEIIDRDGVWIVGSQIRCESCGSWEPVDGIHGIVGQIDESDMYVTDVKAAAIAEFEKRE